jgi:hypothetical protein
MWEPVDHTHKGEVIQKNRERFREDILILAGYYEVVCSVDGRYRVVARSISFANCDDLAFEQIYRSVLNVVWEKILRGTRFKDRAEVDFIVGQLLSYEG